MTRAKATPERDWQDDTASSVGDKQSGTTTIARPTARTAGERRIRALCETLGLSEHRDALLDALAILSEGWGGAPLGTEPEWQSDICNDHSPFELSVAFGGGEPELRLLVEARDQPTLVGQRDAARRATRRLCERFPSSLERYESVEDLFLPEEPVGLFCLWHAISCRADRQPELKAYFNLQVRGAGARAALCEEALARLGMAGAWPEIAAAIDGSTPGRHELAFFALDLAPRADARVKVYLRHHAPAAEALEAVMARASRHHGGDVSRVLSALGVESLDGRALVSCLGIRASDPRRPEEATLYFPLASYVDDDRQAADRIRALHAALELESPLAPVLDAVAGRPLEAGVGLVTYVSYKRTAGGARSTVYFSPELFRVFPPGYRSEGHHGLATPEYRHATPEAVVACYEERSLTDHPYFRRLRREPPSLARLWLLLASFKRAIIDEFPRRLASLTARVRDDRVRCVLAAQLHDELGCGDYDRAHRGLFERMFRSLEQHAPQQSVSLAHADALGQALEHAYVEADASYGVGASLLVEVFGKQVDQFVGAEFRRSEAEGLDLEWLHLHEQLEVEHADESMQLARLIEDGEPCARARQGALDMALASARFFDALYAQTFA